MQNNPLAPKHVDSVLNYRFDHLLHWIHLPIIVLLPLFLIVVSDATDWGDQSSVTDAEICLETLVSHVWLINHNSPLRGSVGSGKEEREKDRKEREKRENKVWENETKGEKKMGTKGREPFAREREKITMLLLLYEGHSEGSSGVPYGAAFQWASEWGAKKVAPVNALTWALCDWKARCL